MNNVCHKSKNLAVIFHLLKFLIFKYFFRLPVIDLLFTGKPAARVLRLNEYIWEAVSEGDDVEYGTWALWVLTWSADNGVKLYINGKKLPTLQPN